MRLYFLLLLLLPFSAFAECTISWDANDPAENVIGYNVYHTPDGTDFVRKLPQVVGTSTTCSAQGILTRTGHVGLTAENSVGESEMSVATFPPILPLKPTSILITITP